MRELKRSAAMAIADNQHWLDRQRSLETELLQVRQAQRSMKRKHAAAIAAAVAASTATADESGNDNWMMTYLDMMTLLLVVSMAMLAMAGASKRHDTPPSSSPALEKSLDSRHLTHMPEPGTGHLLLVAQPPAPAPQPAAEPAVPAAAPEAAALAGSTPASEPVEPAAPPQPSIDELLKALPLDRLGDGIEVVRNDSTVSFRISSEILFPSSQSDLNLQGLKVLHNLVPVLAGVPHKVIVAGHTDTQDIRSARFPSNWELSSARAGSVVRYLQSNGIHGDRLSAVGYADTRPLADNTSTAGRATNRRVELILQP